MDVLPSRHLIYWIGFHFFVCPYVVLCTVRGGEGASGADILRVDSSQSTAAGRTLQSSRSRHP